MDYMGRRGLMWITWEEYMEALFNIRFLELLFEHPINELEGYLDETDFVSYIMAALKPQVQFFVGISKLQEAATSAQSSTIAPEMDSVGSPKNCQMKLNIDVSEAEGVMNLEGKMRSNKATWEEIMEAFNARFLALLSLNDDSANGGVMNLEWKMRSNEATWEEIMEAFKSRFLAFLSLKDDVSNGGVMVCELNAITVNEGTSSSAVNEGSSSTRLLPQDSQQPQRPSLQQPSEQQEPDEPKTELPVNEKNEKSPPRLPSKQPLHPFPQQPSEPSKKRKTDEEDYIYKDLSPIINLPDASNITEAPILYEARDLDERVRSMSIESISLVNGIIMDFGAFDSAFQPYGEPENRDEVGAAFEAILPPENVNDQDENPEEAHQQHVEGNQNIEVIQHDEDHEHQVHQHDEGNQPEEKLLLELGEQPLHYDFLTNTYKRIENLNPPARGRGRRRRRRRGRAHGRG